MSVRVRFLPDDVVVAAEPGEPLLQVAERAGVFIATGCLMGSCHACEVELEDGTAVRACISSIPGDRPKLTVNIYEDLAW
ncbi:2Fe-2S iron-sulfur cluster-binding protein [Myxosarcina sp. GI1]|uniref:2Fe-2S iron-sulfur cluster-binding protein n=1 Tax=Myxosarcina sp. GI1 TaxID=1541065 RepID=UPI000566C59D|nr:2Fe-2S iron-sulfur cluster-binding protein [Myxosarcina sp. GI1]